MQAIKTPLFKHLKSTIDATQAFVAPFGRGKIETRYVRRTKDKLSLYVSSHSGCKMGCQFCHLTKNKSTDFKHVDLLHYTSQVDQVLKYYDQEEPAKHLYVNFMARGEPMANRTVVLNFDQIYNEFKKRADERSMNMKINISTIMPHTVRDRDLYQIFGDNPVNLYYSLYSLRTDFRTKWMPNALPVSIALDKLKSFQDKTLQPINFHWAFIKGQNDNPEDVQEMAKTLKRYNFIGKFNLVRYNPPDETSQEPDEQTLTQLFDIMKQVFEQKDEGKSKIVSRVGKDVYASCGMFEPDDL